MTLAKSNIKLRRDKEEGRHWSCKKEKSQTNDYTNKEKEVRK